MLFTVITMNQPTRGITRNAIWYSQEDFDLECGLMEGYLEEDLGQYAVVYQVDRQKTQVNSIYQESKNNIRFKMPCAYEIKSSEVKSYDQKSANGIYSVSGGLTMYVMPSLLVKYRCDIKRGDYIGIMIEENRMSYFVVTNDGKVNNANENFVGAFKPAWRKVECAPTTLEEFSGK